MTYSWRDRAGPARVLEQLDRGGGHVAGSQIAARLGTSRVSVWKRIAELRRLGYGIGTARGRGYRLESRADRLLPWEVSRDIGTKKIGRRAYYHERIGSTQAEALRLAPDPAEEGAVVAAGTQTRGRGRLGRRWASPRGGIWMSVIVRPRLDSSAAPLVPVAAAVALAGAVRAAGADARLKWPNDVLIGSKKAAGIVTDASLESNRLEYAVIGAGINYGTAPRAGGFQAAAVPASPGGRLAIAQGFLRNIEAELESLERGGSAGLVQRWTAMADTPGRRVSVDTGSERVSGTAVRMDPDGALVVRAAGGDRRVLAGDASHLR